MTDFLDNISKLGWALIASSVSLIVYIVLERFKTRAAIFTYTEEFNSVGTTFGNSYFQNLDISVAGRKIQHLNFISVNFKNESNLDYENVPIKFWVDPDSTFLNFDGHHDQFNTSIEFEDAFLKRRIDSIARIEEFNANNTEKGVGLPQRITEAYNLILKNAVFIVPVWNRKDSVTFKFLVENTTGSRPSLGHPIEKKSINLIPSQTEQDKTDKMGLWMLILGHLFYVLFAIYIMNIPVLSNFVLWTFVIFSGLYLWIGLFVYKIFQYLTSYFK